MALKDKLMTLEDFKAVRDVDVASNSAQFTEIKADLDALFSIESLVWVNGAISSTNGSESVSNTRLRSDVFSNANRVSCDNGYKYIIAAYNGSAYAGMWNGTSLVNSVTWLTTETDLSELSGYNLRLVFAKTDNTVISTDESEHMRVYARTNASLSKAGIPADAEATGKAIELLSGKSLIVQRTLTASDNLDTITGFGLYDYSNSSLPTNAPNVGIGGLLVVYTINNKTIQMFHGRSNTEERAASRVLTSNGWSNWSTAYAEPFCRREALNSTNNLDDAVLNGAHQISAASLPVGVPINEGGVLCVYKSVQAVAQIYKTALSTYARLKTASGTWTNWQRLDNDTPVITELPALELSGDITGMSKDDSVTLDYSLFGQTGTCTCKWQGSSSVRYAKKNYTIKFDTGFDAMTGFVNYINTRRAANGNVSRLPANTRWGTQTKYCLKANWVDPSMMRNIVCARLWGQIVNGRITAGDVIDNRTDAPNYGAIDGFPVEIKLNGESLGLYTMNIPKDKWQFDMGEGAAEYVVSGEDNNSNACRWKVTALVDGTDYSVEYAPDNVQDSTIATSLNTAIQAAIGAGADWETTLAPYLDIDSVFDYFIFACCVNNHDALARNILYCTYDGVKWFMSAYDMDTTFGVDPYGTLWFDVVNDRNQFAQAAAMHRLAYLIYTYSKGKLKTRYQALRSTILSDANVYKELSNFGVLIPQRDYDIDREIWQSMPGTSIANIPQYMEYYRMHCKYLDEEIDALVN